MFLGFFRIALSGNGEEAEAAKQATNQAFCSTFIIPPRCVIMSIFRIS
jgi:hypothetical protein